jgi:serine/threonine-protein kinase RsbW/stage II sporulation protein AB (anti-sigma F factor)
MARHAVIAYGNGCEANPGDLALAVSEAVSNAVLHAYRDTEEGRVRLRAEIEGGDLLVQVADDGVGMKPNPRAAGLGMGLGLIGSLANEANLESSGNGLRVVMRFPGPRQPSRSSSRREFVAPANRSSTKRLVERVLRTPRELPLRRMPFRS